MTDLLDHQFELDGFVFGLGCDLSITEDGFDPGSAEWMVQDADMYGSGATQFGADAIGAPTWAFTGFTDREDVAGAIETLQAATAAWRNREGRRVVGKVSTLRYAINGRTRRIYGRPRRWSAPPTNLILSGMVPVVADFRAADHRHYDDDMQEATLHVVPSVGGGFTVPFTAPIMTLSDGGARQNAAVIDGDEDTPAVITFRGPSVNAWLKINGEKIQVNGALAYDEELVIDAAPWYPTVRVNGVPRAGMLTRGTYMAKMMLEPGPVLFEYGAIDASGTSNVTVGWRAAWSSL